ncbi:hypothetical protein [Polaribacter sp. Hel1_85]|jgi:hypothetical protein|uniref:hypothetical protein n=1 Tax=Polaribacter sp. Hel1_85 TaxID=1250005 RepID=UPI00052BEDB5|nr:hypothetical protein [Polaribacter sp. Hel1_85]KGL58411.1 hypothetical protein PHEL85_3470 [Polaribacter sp. Hel1_85]
MNELFELNSENLKKGYFWITGVLNFIFVLFLAFFYSELSLKWIIIIFFGTSILAPFFILSVWSYEWFSNRRNYNRIYSKNPYNNLKQIGFDNRAKSLINTNGMVDYVHFSKFNNWEIYFGIGLLKPKIVTFSINGKIPDLKKAQSEFGKLKTEKIKIDEYGVFWEINTKKENLATIECIENKLISMVKIAEKLNCEKTITSEYEKY